MTWLAAAISLLFGLLGREAWELLPGLARLLLRLSTSVLPPERRELRRAEWEAELPQFGERRLSAALWALSLLPICIWEAVTGSRAIREIAILLRVAAFGLPLLAAMGLPVLLPIGVAVAFLNPLHLSDLETLAFLTLSPLILSPLMFPIVAAIDVLAKLKDWLTGAQKLVQRRSPRGTWLR